MAIDWTGSIGLDAGSLLGGNGPSLSFQYRRMRDHAAGINSESQRGSILGAVQGAREAGVHPVFALGGAQGAAPQMAIPGQSNSGSHADVGLQMISEAEKKRIDATTKNQELRNQLLQIELDKLKKPSGGLDADVQDVFNSNFAVPPIDTRVQELDKGKVQPFKKKSPTSNLNVISPATGVRIGSQKIYMLAEDAESLAENPMFILGMASMYKENKDVDWAQVWNEYTGAKPTPTQTTTGTFQMFERMKGIKPNVYRGMGKTGWTK